ncbi:MAG: hypothetical protein Q9220_003815 [cf. Caloplaca sp. 1 TL-2023]
MGELHNTFITKDPKPCGYDLVTPTFRYHFHYRYFDEAHCPKSQVSKAKKLEEQFHQEVGDVAKLYLRILDQRNFSYPASGSSAADTLWRNAMGELAAHARGWLEQLADLEAQVQDAITTGGDKRKGEELSAYIVEDVFVDLLSNPTTSAVMQNLLQHGQIIGDGVCAVSSTRHIREVMEG